MLITLVTLRVKRTLNELMMSFKLVAIATFSGSKTDMVLFILSN